MFNEIFTAVLDIKIGYVLCGIIWSVALGFAVGNYACSLVHRLPRGRLILDKPPYCGTCGAELQTLDLFPVFSALWLRHRCRYCKTPFPVSHTWTELLVGLLFMMTFFKYNFGQEYVLIVCMGVFMITLAAIEVNEGIVMGRIMLCIAVSGMLWRTLEDGNIYGFFQGGFLALMAGAVLWNKQVKKVGHIYTFPAPARLLALGGICVGQDNLPVYFLLFAIFYAVDWLIRKLMRAKKPAVMTVAFGFAAILPAVYPKLETALRHLL